MFSVGLSGTSFTYDAREQSLRRRRRDGVLRVPHVPVAVPVPVDPVGGPRPGDELRYACAAAWLCALGLKPLSW